MRTPLEEMRSGEVVTGRALMTTPVAFSCTGETASSSQGTPGAVIQLVAEPADEDDGRAELEEDPPMEDEFPSALEELPPLPESAPDDDDASSPLDEVPIPASGTGPPTQAPVPSLPLALHSLPSWQSASVVHAVEGGGHPLNTATPSASAPSIPANENRACMQVLRKGPGRSHRRAAP